MRIDGACITIEAIACSARIRGSSGGPAGAGTPFARKIKVIR
jgi:hypothetical protein